MNIRDLEYIIAVSELRSFSQAAERCFVSQPTLSGQIKKLEQSLGVMLFERTNKSVMPTEIGTHIIQAARRAISEVSTIREIAETAHDPFSGKFRLGAFPTLASYLFPALVPHLVESMPALKLILIEEKTDQLIEKLRKGSLDAAFLALPVEQDYFHSTALFDDPFYLAVPPSHSFAKQKSVKQEALFEQPILLLEEGHCLRDQSLEVCQLMGISEDPDFRATSLETLREMVKANTGITLLPKIALRENDEGICYVPFADDGPYRRIGLVWRKTTARTAVIENVIERVQEQYNAPQI